MTVINLFSSVYRYKQEKVTTEMKEFSLFFSCFDKNHYLCEDLSINQNLRIWI